MSVIIANRICRINKLIIHQLLLTTPKYSNIKARIWNVTRYSSLERVELLETWEKTKSNVLQALTFSSNDTKLIKTS